MNLESLTDFFAVYSLPSVIIAIIIAIICILVDKLFLKKIYYGIRAYLPFVLGIIFYILYDLIFNGISPKINELSVSAGLVSGSLSSVFFSLIRRIVTGKGALNVASPLILLIENVIFPIVPEQKLKSAILEIERLLNGITEDEKETVNAIANVILEHSTENTTEDECLLIAKVIVVGKSNLKKQ